MSDQFNFEPTGVLTDENKYALQNMDMYNLLKLTWTGSLLPVSEHDFKLRYNISDNGYNKTRQYLDPLVEVFQGINRTSSEWNDTDYPKVVSLASDILDYAETVAGEHGDTLDAYYSIIFDDIIQLGKETDPGTIKDLKDTISGLIDDRVEAIGDLITSADGVSKTLTQFEKDLKTEQADLAPRLTDVQNDLAGKGGKVTQLQSEIDGIKKNIAADQKRYEHDVVMATTALSYEWCGAIGAIAAATVMGVYGSDAVKMKNEINRLNDLMQADEQELQDDLNIVGALSNLQANMNNLTVQFGPAIKAVEDLKGYWGSIQDDLTEIQKYLDKDVRKMHDKIANIQKDIFLKKWWNLAKEIKSYRVVAYVTPQQTTLAQYTKDINNAVQG